MEHSRTNDLVILLFINTSDHFFFARFSRYQKKIGTYDKQQWEKTLEQRFINNSKWVPVPRANLKTNLIDVDLVRGEIKKTEK